MNEVSIMEYLRDMQMMEGWQIVEKFINERIEDNRSRLESCDIEDVEKHRHKIDAYKSIFRFIEDSIDAGLSSPP